MIEDIIKKVEQFDQAGRRERLQSPQIIQTTKAVRFPVDVVSDLYIFEVQSAATAPGIYGCFKQTTFGVFSPPVVEVLNLIENNTIEDYTPALAVGDRIAAWQMPDEAEGLRWIGYPITPSVRMARVTTSVSGFTYVYCNLISNDGETEITSGLGFHIKVYGRITRDINHIEYNLNYASPRLLEGDYIFVENISGKWWCTTVFQCSKNCVCNN